MNPIIEIVCWQNTLLENNKWKDFTFFQFLAQVGSKVSELKTSGQDNR
jgi:hypothetical protein